MNWLACGLGYVWTLGRGTHESGSLSYGTQGHEERGREDSLRRGTVSMRARERDKQTSPDFCAQCVKYNFLWGPEMYFIKLLGTEEKYMSSGNQ